jgi:hypothetical protein
MIIRTRLDPAAIRDAVAASDDGGREILTRLATELRRHGVLVTGSDGKELKEALDPRGTTIKPAVSQLWGELFLDLERWGRLLDADRSTGAGAAGVDLTVSDDPAIASAGEVTSPDLIDRSPAIQGLRQMKYEENYKPGSDSLQIWGDRFAPCSRISRRVTVVDQYLFAKPAVVPWILQRLAKDAPGIAVDLIGAAPSERTEERTAQRTKERTAEEVKDQLTTLAPKDRPTGQVLLWLVPWGQGPRPHNRHIRFDRIAAFTLEEGFDRFLDGRRPIVRGPSGVTPHYVSAGDPHLDRLAEIERRLKKATPEAQHFLLGSQTAAR